MGRRKYDHPPLPHPPPPSSAGKYAFFTLTFVVWVLYLVCLHQTGKGVRHPTTGARLPMTDEQNWAALLGGLCVW